MWRKRRPGPYRRTRRPGLRARTRGRDRSSAPDYRDHPRRRVREWTLLLGKPEGEFGSLPGLAGHVDPPSEQVGHPLAEVKAEARSRIGWRPQRVELLECLEQASLILATDPDAGVDHAKRDLAALPRLRLHLLQLDAHGAPVGELDRVSREVDEDLHECPPVRPDLHFPGRQADLEPKPLGLGAG